ncbi:hypothetical protein D7X33_20835 [Butyricicoccus sp. 1XD8-22]|nr:hypothetical protein D7X33_20835 [Butyricicoccus sp. 1XD8-22]
MRKASLSWCFAAAGAVLAPTPARQGAALHPAGRCPCTPRLRGGRQRGPPLWNPFPRCGGDGGCASG